MAALVALRALACSAAALQPPDVLSRAEALRTLGLPVAGYAAFRTGAALSVINQPRVPEIDAPVVRLNPRGLLFHKAGLQAAP